MSEVNKPYRTVFVVELKQQTGLSTGGRDGDLYADAIMARDGQGRPVLRGSGLAGALLAMLNDFNITIPDSISRGIPDGPRDEDTAESLWLVRHAHLITDDVTPMVRPNVAIHPWTGAAVDGLYFSTEVVPRGARWRLIIETDDWREQPENKKQAASLLALALREWQHNRCWLGRSPARGLGWAELINLQIFTLDERAASFWPDAEKDDKQNITALQDKAKDTSTGVTAHDSLDYLLEDWKPKPERLSKWDIYTGKISVGESSLDKDSYGLDTLSTLARDFPADQEQWSSWRKDKTKIQGQTLEVEDIDLDSAPAWTPGSDGKPEFMVPGSAIRGTLRATLSAHWRRAGEQVWVPNSLDKEPEKADSDPLLPLFGSINHDSNLLISDAWPIGHTSPQLYVQEQHAEDEFTQGPYGSSKFNRPCLVSGEFEFKLAIRKAVSEHGAGLQAHSQEIANRLIATINTLGEAKMLPIGGGIWRGHGWVKLSLKHDETAQSSCAEPEAMEYETEAV